MMMSERGLRPVAELGAEKPHGTRLRYMAGCKCLRCRMANSNYETMRSRARKNGDWNGIVNAGPARRHIMRLSAAGVGRAQVSAASDIAFSIICSIKSGKRKHLRARTLRKILAVTTDCRADRAVVDASKTWRLIGLLLEEGYTKARIARELGRKTPALQVHRERVYASTAAAIERVYLRLTL